MLLDDLSERGSVSDIMVDIISVNSKPIEGMS
jgi:hypothetical protein